MLSADVSNGAENVGSTTLFIAEYDDEMSESPR